jgi:hypothetical protein
MTSGARLSDSQILHYLHVVGCHLKLC